MAMEVSMRLLTGGVLEGLRIAEIEDQKLSCTWGSDGCMTGIIRF